MWLIREAASQVLVGLMILGIGTWIFCLVNRWRQVPVEVIDPNSGERKPGTRWERGTRRSRWRGYCVIGGAMLGYQAVAVANLVGAAMRGGNGAGVGMAIGETAPCGMVAGLLAGLALGAISSRFLPEQAPPRDPDAG